MKVCEATEFGALMIMNHFSSINLDKNDISICIVSKQTFLISFAVNLDKNDISISIVSDRRPSRNNVDESPQRPSFLIWVEK